jgi:hypothetical protein
MYSLQRAPGVMGEGESETMKIDRILRRGREG